MRTWRKGDKLLWHFEKEYRVVEYVSDASLNWVVVQYQDMRHYARRKECSFFVAADKTNEDKQARRIQCLWLRELQRKLKKIFRSILTKK